MPRLGVGCHSYFRGVLVRVRHFRGHHLSGCGLATRPAPPAPAVPVIRLLAIDIDGTLLDSRGRLPDDHRQALIDATAAGVEVALVTGRSFHFTAPVVDRL